MKDLWEMMKMIEWNNKVDLERFFSYNLTNISLNMQLFAIQRDIVKNDYIFHSRVFNAYQFWKLNIIMEIWCNLQTLNYVEF